MRKHRSNGWLSRVGVVAGMAYGGREILRRRRRIDLRGKVILITGGSRRLGLVMARQLADQGARLAICARDGEELERGKAQLRYNAADVLAVECDVTKQPQVNGMIEGILQHFGRIDVLINNAGVISTGPLETMTLADFALAMNTNFYAPLFCTLAVLPHMRARKFGRIVNISSIGAIVPLPHLTPYVASKFALTGLSQSLRTELLKDNIFVTTVNPGLMRTGSARNALFKGRHVEKYAWFKTLDSLPVTSISANRAAAEIIDAFRHGQANLTISLQAKLAATIHGLFPSLTSEIGALLNYLLPPPGGIGARRMRGADSESPMTKSPLTKLSDEAAVANNEIR